MGCPSIIKMGEKLCFTIVTHSPETGSIESPDEKPEFFVYKNLKKIGNGTMARLEPGLCGGEIDITEKNGFELNKCFTIFIKASVEFDIGGISYEFIVRE